MNDPVVPFEIRFVADGFLGSLPARRLIVRMKSLKEFLESRWRASVIEPQHVAAHLRAVSDITGRGIPCPTASLAESLRLRQICFALTQPLLGALTVLDVCMERIPVSYLAFRISRWYGAHLEPAVNPIRAKKTGLNIKVLARFDRTG